MSKYLELLKALNNDFHLCLSLQSRPTLVLELTRIIDSMIKEDFEKLIFILYRVDVSEDKLKNILKLNNGMDAAKTIADLIILRQFEKIKSRAQFTTDSKVDDEERW